MSQPAIDTRLPGYRANDVHSKLNACDVALRVDARGTDDVVAAIQLARDHGLPLATCGGRHAMGGQQFASDGVLLDMSGMDRILDFDTASGLIEVEAGIQWPQLVAGYQARQRGARRQWSIRQKQTGADRLSIGGALAANIHGRVLVNKPLVEDVVSFRLVDAGGRLRTVSRDRDPELFRLAIGGYGLFGPIVSATLQLVPRRKLERVVELGRLDDLPDAFASRIADGYLYGDFQFATDDASADFLDRGVFSCYRPVDTARPIPDGQIYMTAESWQGLLYCAHTDKARAFERFAAFYTSTSGQLYWTDTHQISLYLDDYHAALDERLGCRHPGTEMITELYVPMGKLPAFMNAARELLREHRADLIYGTIRLIRRDDETFLAWAREDSACVIFNLHVEHTPAGIAANAETFRALIDLALLHSGRYFLTYHRFATREQVAAAYPQFPAFLAEKRARDPDEVFASDWYRHYASLFGDRS